MAVVGALFRTRPIDLGRARYRYLRRRFGEEVRVARCSVGLSQGVVAQRAGVTQSFVSAVERGERGVTLDVACRLAAAVGHDVGLKLFPGDGVPLRDSGQVALAKSIAAGAHPSWHARLEVPVSDDDRRAADLVLEGPDELLHIEIERRVWDFQAQLRSATLKRAALAQRHDRPVRLVLAVPDRKSTRRVLRQLAPLLQRTLPVQSRRVWAVLQGGGTLGGDGIMFVREAAPP